MRSNSVLWGAALVLAGTLLLLDLLDIIAIDFWRVIGPLLLVLFGVWLVGGILWGPRRSEAAQATVPLRGATRATVEIEHDAGRLVVGAAERSTDLMSGTFVGGVERHVRNDGNALQVTLKPADGGALRPLPWGYRRGYHWTVDLNPEIPIALTLQERGGDARIDLRHLRVTALAIDAWVGAVEVTMPARAGHIRAAVKSTAGAVSVRVPEAVACRIHAAPGLATLLVDRHRFPRVVPDHYESPGYEGAAQRVDLYVETAVGTITVR